MRQQNEPQNRLVLQEKAAFDHRRGFPLRLFLYLVFIGLVLWAERRLVLRFGFERILLENTVVEWASAGVCALTFLIFVGIAFREHRMFSLGLALGGLSLAACIREMDFFLASLVSKRFHHTVLFLVLILVPFVLLVHRRTLWEEGKAFLYRPGFLLVMLGFIMVVFWAQVLGERRLWGYFAGIYPIDVNGVKCMVEESLELVGYLLICFGAVEELILTFREGQPR